MPRFFVQKEQISEGVVSIFGDDAHHISRALRMAAGESITVCDMQSFEYECELTDFLPDRVLARILTTRQSDTEPPYRAHIYQALPKGDKLDSIIQKAVECGAASITTFESERCVVRMKKEAEARKTERRQRIAEEAAKQCGRGKLVRIMPSLKYTEMLSSAKESDAVLFCYEGDGTESLKKILSSLGSITSLSVIVGSEGGFSRDEADLAVNSGAIAVNLGPRILRCETAPSYVLSAISFFYEL